MRRSMLALSAVIAVVAVVALAGAFARIAPASAKADGRAAPIYGITLPRGYRDWRLVSVAREEAPLDDIRAILGNDVAIRAYRSSDAVFPSGTVIARVAWSYDSSPENDRAFGRRQSFVAGHPRNGVQFMVKDARRYAATGGWGYAQFEEGVPASDSVHRTCFACHVAAANRDYVFTRYAR